MGMDKLKRKLFAEFTNKRTQLQIINLSRKVQAEVSGQSKDPWIIYRNSVQASPLGLLFVSLPFAAQLIQQRGYIEGGRDDKQLMA